METTQAVGTIEHNPIGLDQSVTGQIVKALDADLSALIAQFHQYYKHHWLVKGPQFRELHLFFQDQYEQVQKHFDAIAERITMLGGVPTSSMEKEVQQSFIASEEEGDHPIREMVMKDLKDEALIATSLRKSIDLCIRHKDWGTEYLLKKVLYHCENRAHELDHFLANDSLLHVPKKAAKH